MSLRPTQKTTAYLEQEGRSQMATCIDEAFSYAKASDITTMVMFTGSGDGPLLAAQNYLISPEHKKVRLIAVTPPYKKAYRSDPLVKDSPVVISGISSPMRDFLKGAGVEICSGQLLFKPLRVGGKLDSEWSRVEAALSIMGGGLALCVQAIILACDAGYVNPRSQVVALTADTAIDAFAARTEDFLSETDGLIINHIICRPAKFTISKANHRIYAPVPTQLPLPAAGAMPPNIAPADTPSSKID